MECSLLSSSDPVPYAQGTSTHFESYPVKTSEEAAKVEFLSNQMHRENSSFQNYYTLFSKIWVVGLWQACGHWGEPISLNTVYSPRVQTSKAKVIENPSASHDCVDRKTTWPVWILCHNFLSSLLVFGVVLCFAKPTLVNMPVMCM